MKPIPTEAQEFTTDWFNDVLGTEQEPSRIVDSTVSAHAAPGQTAEIYFAKLSYDKDAGGRPTELIIKATSLDPVIIELINTFDQYRREVAFYNELSGVGISVPHCYYAAHDPDNQRMVLLLENLEPAESPSWSISPDEVRLAAKALPAFHANWWNDSSLRGRDWLVQQDDHDFYGSWFGAAAEASPTVREHFGTSMQYSEDLARIMADGRDRILAHLQTRNFTLVHGDYHGKQMFFPTERGGRFAIIDWQFPFRAQGPWDLARIVSLGLETSTRQRIEKEILDTYYSGLLEGGVQDYSHEEFLHDYRIGIAASQMIMLVALADTDPTIVEAECRELGLDWKDIFLRRGDAHLRDHAVLDTIRTI